MSEENVSSKYTCNWCPSCECEVQRIWTRTKGQVDKQNMELSCLECGKRLSIRKIGRSKYGVSLK